MNGQSSESTIGEVCELVRPRKTKESHPVLTFKGLHPDGTTHLSKAEVGQFAIANAGDVVFTKQGHTAGWAMKKIGIITSPVPVHVAGTLQVVRPRSAVDSRYLYYWLRRQETYDYVLRELAGRAGITDSVLNSIPIRIISIAEQTKIVRLLDRLFEKIAATISNTEKSQQNARRIFESHLRDVFGHRQNGWVTTSLAESCEMYQPKGISIKDLLVDGAYPVYGANGVIGRYDQFNHETPQLLITCRGATCGSVNVSQPFSWITGNAMVVRSKDDSLNMRFLEYLFRGGIDVKSVITGTAQPQITRAGLSPLVFSYPSSLKEQLRIVTKLDELSQHVEALSLLFTRKTDALKMLAQSMLRETLNGTSEAN